MGAVELGGDLHGEPARRIASSVTYGVGRGGDEVAAQPDEHLGLALAAAPGSTSTVSRPCSRGGSKPNSVCERVEEVLRRPLPDAHRAVALDVGVAADRAQPGAGLADVALQQGDVDDLLDRGHGVAVLGDAHRPAGARCASESRQHARGLLDLRPVKPGGPLDGRPSRARPIVRRPRVEADGVLLDEVLGRRSPISSSSEPIAWNSARSPLTRTGRCRSASSVPMPLSPRAFCGLRNRTKPASFSGLIARILAPFFLAFSSAVSIRGWLVPGFWPMITISSASWMSSRLTCPCRCRSPRRAPTEVDSWHMFEQSGMLLVPKARTNSW